MKRYFLFRHNPKKNAIAFVSSLQNEKDMIERAKVLRETQEGYNFIIIDLYTLNGVIAENLDKILGNCRKIL